MDDVVNSYICGFIQALEEVAIGNGVMGAYSVKVQTIIRKLS